MKALALILVMLVAGCATVDYGALPANNVPGPGGCADADSVCARGRG